jgi:hypothetical protein
MRQLELDLQKGEVKKARKEEQWHAIKKRLRLSQCIV